MKSPTIDAQLADRTASLANSPRHTPIQAPSSQLRPTVQKRQSTGVRDQPGNRPTAPTETLLAELRLDLGEAQRSKAELEARLKRKTDELEGLKIKFQTTSNRAQELSTERAIFVTRVKDRDEEIRGKAKLLEV